MEITNPATTQLESGRRKVPGADALYGPGGYENIDLGNRISGLTTCKRISEEWARSQREAMEKDARHCFVFFRNNIS